jgi:hypothetical protein
MSDLLSSKDIKDIINQPIADNNVIKLPLLNIFGNEVDVKSFRIFLYSVIIWSVLSAFLLYLKIWQPYFTFFYYLFIGLSIFNLLNSPDDLIKDQNTLMLETQSQDNFIQGTISIFAILYVFLGGMKIKEDDKSIIYKLLTIALLISATSLFIYNHTNDSVNISTIKKVKQTLFNQALVLFCMSLFLIFRSQWSLNV